MIVLVWEIFLTSLRTNVDQAVFYSSLVMSFLLRGHHLHLDNFTYDIIHISKRQIWEHLMGRSIKYTGKHSIQNSGNARSSQNTRGSLNRRSGRHGSGIRHRNSHRKKYQRTVKVYRKLPLSVMSRVWGKVSQLHLPPVLRRPLLGLYVWMCGVNLNEAADEDLTNYHNLSEFFRRQLKPHVRPIDEIHSVTSPCDGKILYYGLVEHGLLEQVKGVTYSLKEFLGPLSWQQTTDNHISDEEYTKNLKMNPKHDLYHCVIYLAPGDYHRFHSATHWEVKYRRHFPGNLLSVSPHVVRRVAGLYNYNERAVYIGQWDYGFFSYTAVGATNVGSITIYCDKDLETNIHAHKKKKYIDKNLCDTDNSGLSIHKGEMFGEFNFGSTIVLVFEAPKNFNFRVRNEQKVKFGQPIGAC